MDEVKIAIDGRLQQVGDTVDFSCHLDEEAQTLGERTFTLPTGADVDVVLTNAGEGILVTGIVRAEVVGTCDRCLDEARFEVAGEVDEYFLFQEPTPDEAEALEEEGMELSLVGADSTIDLTDAITSAFVMDIPYVVLCREDCKGLCPVCGENLNHVDCGHAQGLERQEEERRIANSPFAVLKDLKLDE